MTNPLSEKQILLGVTGSIAAYKSADLASKLVQQGAVVHAILTESAQKFISPLTMQSVSGYTAYTDKDLWGESGHILHVQIGRNADCFLVAPASANTIAKLANGIADNLLTITALAADCPVVIAPAMDSGMYEHQSTQRNIEILKNMGMQIIDPAEGHLASGLSGKGRMEEVQTILNELRFLFSRSGVLKGKKVVVSAGATREYFDPVRFITNRSSGKQGYALAQAALDTGAQVVLITAPTSLEPPTGAKVKKVESAEDMHQAIKEEILDAHALIMAAAVADYKPPEILGEKIKKENGLGSLNLNRTIDILAEISKIKKSRNLDLKIIGFAAESSDLKKNAEKKMREKQMDMIVANDISDPEAGFEVDTNRVMIIYSDGSTEQLPLMQKSEVADKIIQHLVPWLTEGTRQR